MLSLYLIIYIYIGEFLFDKDPKTPSRLGSGFFGGDNFFSSDFVAGGQPGPACTSSYTLRVHIGAYVACGWLAKSNKGALSWSRRNKGRGSFSSHYTSKTPVYRCFYLSVCVCVCLVSTSKEAPDADCEAVSCLALSCRLGEATCDEIRAKKKVPPKMPEPRRAGLYEKKISTYMYIFIYIHINIYTYIYICIYIYYIIYISYTISN